MHHKENVKKSKQLRENYGTKCSHCLVSFYKNNLSKKGFRPLLNPSSVKAHNRAFLTLCNVVESYRCQVLLASPPTQRAP